MDSEVSPSHLMRQFSVDSTEVDVYIYIGVLLEAYLTNTLIIINVRLDDLASHLQGKNEIE